MSVVFSDKCGCSIDQRRRHFIPFENFLLVFKKVGGGGLQKNSRDTEELLEKLLVMGCCWVVALVLRLFLVFVTTFLYEKSEITAKMHHFISTYYS